MSEAKIVPEGTPARVYAQTICWRREGEDETHTIVIVGVDGSVWADVPMLQAMLGNLKPRNAGDAAFKFQVHCLVLALETGKLRLVSREMADTIAQEAAYDWPANAPLSMQITTEQK